MTDRREAMRSDEDAVKALAAKIQAAYEGDLPTRSFELNDLTEWLEEQLSALIQETPAEHECGEGCLHASDCDLHNPPALPAGPCSCGAAPEPPSNSPTVEAAKEAP